VKLAQNLRDRGHDPEKVAHFVNRMVFCMFAEDVDLLPHKLFKKMLTASLEDPDSFAANAQQLFAAMARKGGKVGFTQIDWFNGGVFEDDSALPLTKADIKVALAAANRNWSNIDPSIMGTLFERGLDPGKRSQLGAHYTDPEKIMLIVNPVIVEPLTREWEEIKPTIEEQFAKAKAAKDARPPNQKIAARFYQGQRQREENARRAAREQFDAYIDRLRDFRVLDPACGSGNFLYLALKKLKDLERQANIDFSELSKKYDFPVAIFAPVVGPENLKGIEINPFAAELARVSVWIGEIQWMRENGLGASRDPILKPLDTIECRDAVLNADGSEAEWPEADVIIGNPPFLGSYRFIGTLGEPYTETLRRAYADVLPGTIDLVVYWFHKAWQMIRQDEAGRAGLVATNSIRGGANREILSRIVEHGRVFNAWSDEPWVIDGADVRVSLVCFDDSDGVAVLDGKQVTRILSGLNEPLASGSIDLNRVGSLNDNEERSYLGTKKGGPFDFDGDTARPMLTAPLNPNGRPNSDVIFRRFTGADMTKRPADRWVIDFGHAAGKEQAMLYEVPFAYVLTHVKPVRDNNRRPWRRDNYWLHSETAPGLRNSLIDLSRYIGTPRVAKHRVFVWLAKTASIDDGTVGIARDDDTTFGILHSRFHELWSLRMCTWLGVGNDPRYTPTTCFETFPFPEGLAPNIPAAQYADDPRAKAIAKAAARFNELREAWLNPPDLVKHVPEVVPGYPDRILPVNEAAAAILKKRTLTNLYNDRPTWLDTAHRDLDAAVAAAYGWPADLSDEQILERLFALNQQRAAAQ
jgi:type II restriction/modification system DNA methylase subunit YeeA